jgi:predicted dinucleotide-binding enzyme
MFTTVAILGAASPTGQALATSLVSGPANLRLCDQDEAGAEQLAGQLKQLAPQADVEAMACSANASWEADLVILALPLSAQADAVRRIAPFVTQKTVCSVADAAPCDLAVLLPALAELQRLLPHTTIRRLPAPVLREGCTSQDGYRLLELLLRGDAPAL